MTTPAQAAEGNLKGYWQMDKAGRPFGGRVWVDLQVKDPCPREDKAQFLDDITVPDHSIMAPGQTFTKVWRMANAGNTTWASGEYQLSCVSEECFGASGPSVVAFDVPPGGTYDFQVVMQAPEVPAPQNEIHQSDWQMEFIGGDLFGPVIWVIIDVGQTGDFGELKGNVYRDEGDGSGDGPRVPGATVSIDGQGSTAFSSEPNGFYRMQVVPGTDPDDNPSPYLVVANGPGGLTGTATCMVTALNTTDCNIPVTYRGGEGEIESGNLPLEDCQDCEATEEWSCPGSDPRLYEELPTGVFEGKVVEINEEEDQAQTCEGTIVTGVRVFSESGEEVAAEDGTFELEVIPGHHFVHAEKEGFDEQEMATCCRVGSDERTFCCLLILPVEPEDEDPTDEDPVDEDQPEDKGRGCPPDNSTSGHTGGSLLALALLGWVVRRRRRG